MLDEPSIGIDPISRRFMWNLIASMTRTQTGGHSQSVLLTTHSMEEAESLCHRIGIMDDGNLQCLGSAQHLKTKYGDGYELYIKLKPHGHASNGEELVVIVQERLQREHALNIKLLEHHNVILRFSIRCSHSQCIPIGKVFALIESVKMEYEILEYSITQNSLEQVFMHLVDEKEEEVMT